TRILSNTKPRRDSELLWSRTLASVTCPTTLACAGMTILPCSTTSWLTRALIWSPGFNFLAFRVWLNSISRKESLLCVPAEATTPVVTGAATAGFIPSGAACAFAAEVEEEEDEAITCSTAPLALFSSWQTTYAFELDGPTVQTTAATTIQ